MTDRAAGLREQAKRIATAANIASGHGNYKLANQLWAFGERLRNQAALFQLGTDIRNEYMEIDADSNDRESDTL